MKTTSIKGTIKLNGWVASEPRKLSPGLVSRVYRNDDGWTAQETFHGPRNKPLGLLIRDEHGNSLGVVKSFAELP